MLPIGARDNILGDTPDDPQSPLCGQRHGRVAARAAGQRRRAHHRLLADRLGIRLARGRDVGLQAARPTSASVNLKIADAQQKQENQIKAIRSFIAQGVDAIFLAPVVATGWDSVLKEAKEAKIPVVLLDRDIDPSGRTSISPP